MNQYEQLKSALTQSPDNVPLLLLFAAAARDEWNLAEAKQSCEKVLQIDDAQDEARRLLADILLKMGKKAEALGFLEALRKKGVATQEDLTRLDTIAGNDTKPKETSTDYNTDTGLAAKLMASPETDEFELGSESASENVDKEDSTWNRDTDENDVDEILKGIEQKYADQPRLQFEDVGGMLDVKETIRKKIILPLQKPELYAAYGKKAGGGVLLYGPPGCGKTRISRAIAGEIRREFISVGLHEILDMYIGNSEKQLHNLFEYARSKSPSVLFFDEVEALASDRGLMRQSASRTLINQFLAEMDGGNENNEGVLVMAATNAPWHMDPAFRRPGRFDQILFVPPPDEGGREAILKILLKDKPHQKLDFKKVAAKAKEYSGADLAGLIDASVEQLMDESLDKGTILPLQTTHLLKRLKTIKPSTREWFSTAKNYALYSNDSGLYNPVIEHLGIKPPTG